jgi:type II secretory ATPase GspE/PulE/Tfp pilus assembly ATPase PilB-like protein
MWTSKRQIEKALKKKNGTILVTGPTGSGKTTTLYSMMTTLNTPDRKIITLEDPIEYELPGIVQSEVDEKKNYLYSTGLKALMRQDPDVIMIGEIRDLDSATIAMQAAMTGHLVLSTLHTKSA